MQTMTIALPMAVMAKPRMTRSDKWKQRPCVMQFRAWKDEFRLRLRGHKIPPPEAIEKLDWHAEFAIPESWSKKKKAAHLGQKHCSKPDRDNIDKAILDTLFPEDDSGIAWGELKKTWAEKDRLTITIHYKS